MLMLMLMTAIRRSVFVVSSCMLFVPAFGAAESLRQLCRIRTAINSRSILQQQQQLGV